MERQQLDWPDWLLFSLTIVFSAGIGLYYSVSSKNRTASDYFKGSRKLWVIPTAISMVMSRLSAITLVGITSEIYMHGALYVISDVSGMIGLLLTALLIVPVLYKIKITSIYQYVHRRYESKILRRACVFFEILSGAFGIGLAIYTPSLVVEAVTGFPVWAVTIITSVITTLYTMAGGMRGVIWTDVFQGVILLGGLLAMIILGTSEAGGLARVWRISREAGRLNFFDNFNPDPTIRMTFWSSLVSGIFANIGFNQLNVQRFCSVPTLTKGRITVLLGIPIRLLITALMLIMALVIFAYYQAMGCDPVRSGQIRRPDQLFPYFVMEVLKVPGMRGIYFAVLFSAVLSTLSSGINSVAAVFWKDLIEPVYPNLKANRKLLVTKLLVSVIGLISMGGALVIQFLPGSIFTIVGRLVGSVGAPLQTIMWLAFFFPCANAGGALVGAVGAFAFGFWVNTGAFSAQPHRTHLNTTTFNCSFPENVTAVPIPTDPPADTIFALYRISFMLVPLTTVTCGVIVGLIASLIIGGAKRHSRDPRLIVSFASYFCFCLPKSVQRLLWCGVDRDNPPTDDLDLDKEFETDEGQDNTEKGPHTEDSVREGNVMFQNINDEYFQPSPGDVKLVNYENKAFTVS